MSRRRVKSLPKYEQIWRKIRKKAPRVPDITCPSIDDVLSRLDTLSNTTKRLTAAQNKVLNKKIEKLRDANSALRDSGQYWHDACRDLVDDVFKFKKYKNYKR
jgi:ABC-type transporter Mla subunit MlaD